VARTTVRLTFPADLIKDPVIYQIGKNYAVVTSIRRADVAEGSGWVELDLDGEPSELERALDYCRSRGITVEQLPR